VTTTVAVSDVVVVVVRSGTLEEQERRGGEGKHSWGVMGVQRGVCMLQPRSSIEDAAQKNLNDAGLKKVERKRLTDICGEYTGLTGSKGEIKGTL
jgi:hypothetical protein